MTRHAYEDGSLKNALCSTFLCIIFDKDIFMHARIRTASETVKEARTRKVYRRHGIRESEETHVLSMLLLNRYFTIVENDLVLDHFCRHLLVLK